MITIKVNEVNTDAVKQLLFNNPVDEFIIECTKNWVIVINNEKIYIPTFLEKIIEDKNMSCRIYFQARVAQLSPWFLVPGLGQVAAIASSVAVVAHNIATYNPDFEIRKNISGNVRVTNLKKIEVDKLSKQQSKK